VIVLQSLQQEDLKHLSAREVYASEGTSDSRETLLNLRCLRHDNREPASDSREVLLISQRLRYDDRESV